MELLLPPELPPPELPPEGIDGIEGVEAPPDDPPPEDPPEEPLAPPELPGMLELLPPLEPPELPGMLELLPLLLPPEDPEEGEEEEEPPEELGAPGMEGDGMLDEEDWPAQPPIRKAETVPMAVA